MFRGNDLRYDNLNSDVATLSTYVYLFCSNGPGGRKLTT